MCRTLSQGTSHLAALTLSPPINSGAYAPASGSEKSTPLLATAWRPRSSVSPPHMPSQPRRAITHSIAPVDPSPHGHRLTVHEPGRPHRLLIYPITPQPKIRATMPKTIESMFATQESFGWDRSSQGGGWVALGREPQPKLSDLAHRSS